MFVGIAVLSMQPVIVGLVRALRSPAGRPIRWVVLWVVQLLVLNHLIDYFALDASGSWDWFEFF